MKHTTDEEQRVKHLTVSRRWKERNKERVREKCREYDKKRPHRAVTPEQSKAWRVKRLRDPEYRQKIRDYNLSRVRAVQELVRAIKVERGCVDCGYNAHHAALQFDHVNGDKSKNIANIFTKRALYIEIAKCVVRCANCHYVRHFEAKQPLKRVLPEKPDQKKPKRDHPMPLFDDNQPR